MSKALNNSVQSFLFIVLSAIFICSPLRTETWDAQPQLAKNMDRCYNEMTTGHRPDRAVTNQLATTQDHIAN